MSSLLARSINARLSNGTSSKLTPFPSEDMGPKSLRRSMMEMVALKGLERRCGSVLAEVPVRTTPARHGCDLVSTPCLLQRAWSPSELPP